MKTFDKFYKEIDEVMSMAARRQRANMMRRMSNRLAIARKRAMKKQASPDILKKRAIKQAKNIFIKKMTKGMDKSSMSMSKRAQIEKKLKAMSKRIQTVAMKMIPKLRQKEIARKKQMGAGEN
jgi:uncharacterized FlgJ-related protein